MAISRRKTQLKPLSGMTLVEVLVSVFIITALFLGVYSLIKIVLNISAENKFRLGAVMLADQKMEMVKNLPYNSVGTINGIVHGVLLDDETINNFNGIFYVNNLVQYVDDPYDGTLGGTPNDLLSTDYKQVKITVAWKGPFGPKSISAYTKIAPQGMETSAGGGTLTINIFNASGQPVNQANVNIKNTLVSPAVNFNAQTDATGRLDFPGAAPSTEGYQITVTKAGYSTASTTARSVANPNPTFVNSSVLLGQRTVTSLSIDLVSTLIINTIQQSLPDNWKINNDTSGENQTNSRMDIDASGNIYLVWQDYRQSSASKIFAQKYNSSHVKQWATSDVVIGTANNQIMPDIKADDSGNLYTAWNDDSNGNQDCYLIKLASANGQDLWSGARKINTSADNKDQRLPRIALSGSGASTIITIVWQDNRNTDWDTFMQRYDVNHNQLWGSEKKINQNSADGTDQTEPVVIIDKNGYIISGWTDKRNGNQDIYANSINSSGNTVWSQDLKVNTNTGTSNQYAPALAKDSDNNIYFVWTDERSSNQDIYLAKYNASGTPLWASNISVPASTSSAQYDPSIAIDSSNNIFISWTDERNGNQDIYAQKLDTSGNRLWTDDVRININNDSSDQYNSFIAINPNNNMPYATWQDDRSGDFDIYATQFDQYGASSYVSSVPLVITGAKRIGENPVILKYSKSFNTDASGQLSAADMEWDSYSIALAPGYVANRIVMTSPQIPVNLLPNSSQTITLYLEP